MLIVTGEVQIGRSNMARLRTALKTSTPTSVMVELGVGPKAKPYYQRKGEKKGLRDDRVDSILEWAQRKGLPSLAVLLAAEPTRAELAAAQAAAAERLRAQQAAEQAAAAERLRAQQAAEQADAQCNKQHNDDHF